MQGYLVDRCLHNELSWLQNALLPDAVSNISTQKVVGHLIELLDALDMSAHYGLLFFENPDIAVDLCVAELIVVEVPQSRWYLVLSLVVEQHEEGASVVIDLELRPHRLLHSSNQPASQNYVVDRFTFELANIVRSRLSVHDHAHSDWSENFGFSWLLLLLSTLATESAALVIYLLRVKESGGIRKHLKDNWACVEIKS